MEFSYGIVTYNSQNTIIETLESIRYQVAKYGGLHKNYLIISDDCSSDDTLDLVAKWIEKYGHIFDKISVEKTVENGGLCRNYAQMFEYISTNHFIQLAGDDLISSENVYDKLSTLDENELRVHLIVDFSDSAVWNKPENMIKQLYYSKYKHTNKRDIVLLETLSPYASVEIVFLKQHYTKECMEYIKNYRNFEDDTSFYYVLRNNKDVKFRFVMTPIVLYRREEKSLTKMVDTSSQIAFLDDLYRYRKETFRKEKNIFVKIYLYMMLWDNFLMKHRFDASRCIDRKIKKAIEQIQNKKIQKDSQLMEYLENYKRIIARENEHLKLIQKNAMIFLKESELAK